MSMRDVLDRLERLGVIDSVESWVYMRELRNTIAHDYPLDTQEVVLSLNELVGSTETLKLYLVYLSLKNIILQRKNLQMQLKKLKKNIKNAETTFMRKVVKQLNI